MNKKGSLVLVNFMIAVVLILATIVFIQPLSESFDLGYDSMNCDNFDSLSTGSQMTCIVLIWGLPIFIGFCFVVGISYLFAKRYGFIGGGSE